MNWLLTRSHMWYLISNHRAYATTKTNRTSMRQANSLVSCLHTAVQPAAFSFESYVCMTLSWGGQSAQRANPSRGTRIFQNNAGLKVGGDSTDLWNHRTKGYRAGSIQDDMFPLGVVVFFCTKALLKLLLHELMFAVLQPVYRLFRDTTALMDCTCCLNHLSIVCEETGNRSTQCIARTAPP